MRCNQDHHGSILEEVGRVIEAGTTAAIQLNSTVILQPEEIYTVTRQQFGPTIAMEDIIAFPDPVPIHLMSIISTSIEVQDAVAVQAQESGHSDSTSSQVAAIVSKGPLASIEHDQRDDVVLGQRSTDIPPTQESGMIEDKVGGVQAALEQGVSCRAADAKVVYAALQEPKSAERRTSDRSNVHETAFHLLLGTSPTFKGQASSAVLREPHGTSTDKGTSRATEVIPPMRPIAVSPEPPRR